MPEMPESSLVHPNAQSVQSARLLDNAWISSKIGGADKY